MRKSHQAITESFCSIPFNDSHGLRINLKSSRTQTLFGTSHGFLLWVLPCREREEERLRTQLFIPKLGARGFRSFSFDILLLVFL